MLAPPSESSGPRSYSEDDLRMILRIKELLYDERYTISGAREKLAREVDYDRAGGSGQPLIPPLRPLIWAAADKGGGAAIQLDAALESARRVERALDRLSATTDSPRKTS